MLYILKYISFGQYFPGHYFLYQTPMDFQTITGAEKPEYIQCVVSHLTCVSITKEVQETGGLKTFYEATWSIIVHLC